MKSRIFILSHCLSWIESPHVLLCFLTSQLVNLLKLDHWELRKLYCMSSIKGPTTHPVNTGAWVSRGSDSSPSPPSQVQLRLLLEKHRCFQGPACLPWGMGRLQHGFILAFWEGVSRNVLLSEIISFRKKLLFQASTLIWNRKEYFLTPALSHSTRVRMVRGNHARSQADSALTQPSHCHAGSWSVRTTGVESGTSSSQRATDAFDVSIFFVAFKLYDFFFFFSVKE